MVSITQSQRWRQQPAGVTQIDRNHPLARGLVFATVGNMPYAQEMISGNLSQPLGTSSSKTYRTGVGLYSPSNVGNGWYANYDINIFRTIGTDFTIACEFVAESIADSSSLVSAPWADGTFGTPKASFSLRRVTTTSTMMIEIGTTSATEINATFSNAMISDGEKATYVAVRSGATASLRRDDVLMSQASSGLTSGSNVGYNTASHVCLLNRSATSMGSGTGGSILWAYIWNRALTDQEQRDIYYSPYDIVLPVDRTRFYLSAASDAEFSSDFSSGFAISSSIDENTGTSSVFSNVPTTTASGSITNPVGTVGTEFSSEFSLEFGVDSSSSSTAAFSSAFSSGFDVGSVGSVAFSSAFSSGFAVGSSIDGGLTVSAPRGVVGATGSRTIPNRTGVSVASDRISTVAAAGSVTIPSRTGTSALFGIRPSVSTNGARTVPARSGTSASLIQKIAESAAGSRVIPTRSGTSSILLSTTKTVASGSRAVVLVSGSSVLSAALDRISIIGARTIPLRVGPAALVISKDLVSTTGTRTAPAISGPALLTSPKPVVNTSQAFLAVGGSALIVPSSRVSITGTRTSPARTGDSALSAPKQILVGVGSRIITAVSGSSSLRTPKAVAIAFAPGVDASQYGILLSSKCADLMLSAIGTTLNSGIVRIYSGSEPATATAALNGNTQLAQLAFGSTAFGVPMSVNAGRVITANLMTGDSSADADGVATFFRAFSSDGSTIIWQGSAGSELILAASETNSYQIRQGSPVTVISLTVSIRLL